VGVKTVAITAGASAPENLVQELIDFLQGQHEFGSMEEMEIKEEDVRFILPSELTSATVKLHSIQSA